MRYRAAGVVAGAAAILAMLVLVVGGVFSPAASPAPIVDKPPMSTAPGDPGPNACIPRAINPYNHLLEGARSPVQIADLLTAQPAEAKMMGTGLQQFRPEVGRSVYGDKWNPGDSAMIADLYRNHTHLEILKQDHQYLNTQCVNGTVVDAGPVTVKAGDAVLFLNGESEAAGNTPLNREPCVNILRSVPAPPLTCRQTNTCQPPPLTCQQTNTCQPPPVTCQQTNTCSPPVTCQQTNTCSPPVTCQQTNTCSPPSTVKCLPGVNNDGFGHCGSARTGPEQQPVNSQDQAVAAAVANPSGNGHGAAVVAQQQQAPPSGGVSTATNTQYGTQSQSPPPGQTGSSNGTVNGGSAGVSNPVSTNASGSNNTGGDPGGF